MLDSHSDLVTYFKLPDENAHITHFAKAELTPTTDWTDASTWDWRIDEQVRPVWLTEDVERAAEEATRSIAQRMVITNGERDLIVDGCWIIAGTAKIRDVRSGRIVRVQGSATIRDVWGSATISGVWGSATISGVRGSATIRDVGCSATISGVWDSATIRGVWGSATIRDVRGSATISGVGGSATIRDVWGSATIRGVWDSATLDASAKARVRE